jgi:autotransporter-associated beta strand protein
VNFDAVGTPTVRIGGDNSAFTGGLQLDSGLTYVIDSTKAFGTGQTFLNGGTLDANVPLTGADKIGTAVSLGGNGVTFTGENIEFGGALTYFGTGTKIYDVEATQTVTFSGTLDSTQQPGQTTAPNGNTTKRGLGALVLRANASLYAGELLIENGTAVAAIAGALGTGAVSVSPLPSDTATLTINASQTISSLTIGDGGVVVINAAPPAPDEAALATVAVPEPGGAALLAFGALGLLGRRRQQRP